MSSPCKTTLSDDERAVVLEAWREVFVEDVAVCEGMQAGRASPAFDGGVFSPIMDVATHHFHQWVARCAPQVSKVELT
jgi:choline monooxygenase